MPTNDIIAGDRESDATNWSYAKIETDPATGERVAVVVTCKVCEASTRYLVSLGGIFGAFQHVNTCPVLAAMQQQHRAHIQRAADASAKERR